MNLALPALLILLALLPGVVFIRVYLSGTFARRVSLVSPVSEFALYFVAAAPLLALGLYATQGRHSFGLQFGLSVLTGSIRAQDVWELLELPNGDTARALVDYFLLLAFCTFTGAFARRLIWATKLDLIIPILRMRNDWYYLLSARGWGLLADAATWADILVDSPGVEGGRLYRGLVVSWEPDDKGGLSHLTLREASRGHGRGKTFEWREIPSDDFLVVGSHIHSINLHHITYERFPGWTREGIGWLGTRYWRAFWFQEPY